MQVLKKYFKKPPKETLIVYGVSIGILLALFITLYLIFGRTLTEFVTNTQSFKSWLEEYKGLSGVVFVSLPSLWKLPQDMYSVRGVAWHSAHWGALSAHL